MTFLIPDSTYLVHGTTVKKRIIPFGTRCTKDIYYRGKLCLKTGDLYKADKYLLTANHKPAYITVHNTDDIVPANGTTKSEQYSRATWPNQAMGTSRIHYYVDEIEIWQNLLDTEIGWHVSYDIDPTPNNYSISIEIIGADSRAEENGAKLVAYLMDLYDLDISKVRTHKSWSGKNCPCWILPHWDEFLNLVKKYLSNDKSEPSTPVTPVNNNTKLLMKSLGRAAIRTAPTKTGNLIARVEPNKIYPFDKIIYSNNEKWLKHENKQMYSMQEDGVTLFEKVDSYAKYKTTNKLNMRSQPTTSAPSKKVIPANACIYVLDNYKPVKNNGYKWVKIFYNNELGYVASEFLKKE